MRSSRSFQMLWASLSIPRRWWKHHERELWCQGRRTMVLPCSTWGHIWRALVWRCMMLSGSAYHWDEIRAEPLKHVYKSLACLGPIFELCKSCIATCRSSLCVLESLAVLVMRFRSMRAAVYINFPKSGTSSAPWRARTRRSALIALWKDVWLGPQSRLNTWKQGLDTTLLQRAQGPMQDLVYRIFWDGLGFWTSWKNLKKQRKARALSIWPWKSCGFHRIIVLYCTDCHLDWLTPSATWAIIAKAMRGHATALDVQRQLFESSWTVQ